MLSEGFSEEVTFEQRQPQEDVGKSGPDGKKSKGRDPEMGEY